jgi:hypothetical protein
MSQGFHDQSAPGGKIINISNPTGPIYIADPARQMAVQASYWDLSTTWSIRRGEISSMGPSSSALQSEVELLRSFSLCLWRNEVRGTGFLEATVSVPGLALGAAGLVARIEGPGDIARTAGIAFILVVQDPVQPPQAMLLSIHRGCVRIIDTAVLKNYSEETRGLRLGLDFHPGRIRAFLQEEELFDCRDEAAEGAGLLGFIKFDATTCRFADPRFTDAAPPDVPKLSPRERPVRVFISHSSQDRTFAERLAEDLRRHRLSVWFDCRELKVGDSICDVISAALDAVDYLVVILSRASVQSRWVQAELNAALMAELSGKGIMVLPVLMEEVEIPPLLRDRKYADFRVKYNDGLRELLVVFNEEKLSAAVLSPQLATDAAGGPSRQTRPAPVADCVATLASLPLADLRRYIKARADLTSLASLAKVWDDTFQGTRFATRMEDAMAERTLGDLGDCIVELVERAKKTDMLPKLLEALCNNRSRPPPEDARNESVKPGWSRSILINLNISLRRNFRIKFILKVLSVGVLAVILAAVWLAPHKERSNVRLAESIRLYEPRLNATSNAWLRDLEIFYRCH